MTRTTPNRSWFAWLAFALAGFALGLACRTAVRESSTATAKLVPDYAERVR